MAKKNPKKKRQKPINRIMQTKQDIIRFQRTVGTMTKLFDATRTIDEDSLTQYIPYVQDNPLFSKIMLRCEEILYRYLKMDSPPSLKEGEKLHLELYEIADEVKSSKQIYEYYKFFAEINQKIQKTMRYDDTSKLTWVYVALFDILIEVTIYFRPVEMVVSAFNSNNDPLLLKELLPNWDFDGMKCSERVLQSVPPDFAQRIVTRNTTPMDVVIFNGLMRKELEKLGYDFTEFSNHQQALDNENIVHNNRAQCAFLIDEDVYNEFLKRKPSTLIFGLKNILKPVDKSKEEYLSLLKLRKRLLPRGGVHVVGKDEAFGTIHEYFFKEVYLEDKVYLVYVIVLQDDSVFIGYTDIEDEFIYTALLDSSTQVGHDLHDTLCGHLLALYAYLTTDEPLPSPFSELVDKIQIVYNATTSSTSKGERKYVSSGEYIREVHKFDYGIRKLPAGWVASEEAKERALKFGIDLQDGYTFVREHDRALRKKKS